MDVSFQAVTPENDDDEDHDDHDGDDDDDHDHDHDHDDVDDYDDDDDGETQFIPECHFSSTISVVIAVSPTHHYPLSLS